MIDQLRTDLTDLAAEREAALADVFDSPNGLDWCRRHTDLVDRVVSLVCAECIRRAGAEGLVSVVATGGYGRRELAPWSDVDLSAIPIDETNPAIDESVRLLYQGLHSVLGTDFRIELGYSYRLINDAPALDGKSRTAMMDARLVAGAREPFEAFLKKFRDTFPTGEFLLDKIRERERQFIAHHDTPLVVEPHLKEGAGGLRCFQCANWILAAIGHPRLEPADAYEHVLRMRNMLHAVAGRKLDVLSRQRQGEIADRLGIRPEAMGSELGASMLELYEAYRTAGAAIHDTNFDVSRRVRARSGAVEVDSKATLNEAAMGVAIASQLGLAVQSQAECRAEIDGAEALDAIATGEQTLRNLDRSGVLERLLPELTACRTLMPTDTSHAYSVFEHTMRVVRNLDALDPGTRLGEIRAGLSSKGPLYLAALMHDVGKAESGLPHSEAGEILASNVCARWGLGPDTSSLVCWLVREHLTLAKLIRMRDVGHPSTARELASIVSDVERLRMLALLTYADIRAVSADSWTPAQESFLLELYARALEAMESSFDKEPDPAVYRRRLLRELRGEQIPDEELQTFLDSLPAHYVVSTSPELVRLHYTFERRAAQGEPTIEVAHNAEVRSTELTVCCPDSPGLLSRILGCLYAWDLQLHGIRASTTRSERPVALDTFTVSLGDQPLPPATCHHVTADLDRVLRCSEDVAAILRRHGKDPDRRQEHFQYVFVQGNPAILEFQAPRGRGMAYRLSKLIAAQGWNIVAARIGQWAGRGAAAFYVVGPNDAPLSPAQVRSALARKV